MSTILALISGIPGDGESRTFNGVAQKAIRCSAMQHGIDLPVVTRGFTRKSGYSMHGSIHLRHELDVATPKLREAALLGTKLGEVHIVRTIPEDGTTVDAETIKLGQVRLVSVHMETLPSADGEGCAELPMEVFTLDYEEIVWDWRYKPGTGTASTVTGGWDTDDMMTITSIPAVKEETA